MWLKARIIAKKSDPLAISRFPILAAFPEFFALRAKCVASANRAWGGETDTGSIIRRRHRQGETDRPRWLALCA